jgi:hypothetical protein
MAYMFYYNLDGNQNQNKTGTQTAVGGEMLTGIGSFYWSGTEFDSGVAWDFGFAGDQCRCNTSLGRFAWAVRDGDVAAAPEPAVCC